MDQNASDGLSQFAEVYLVAVDQSDKEKQRAERYGPSQDSFDQQHCPTAHQEDMDKQPEDTDRNIRQVTMIKTKTEQCISEISNFKQI